MPSTQTYEYQSDFVRRWVVRARAAAFAQGYSRECAQAYAQGYAQGCMESAAEAVLVVLDVRGIAVTAEARTRFAGCFDAGQLSTWLRRAVVADRIDELFA
jgi:hypothetical protein